MSEQPYIGNYPSITNAYLLMESCNGGLWGPRGPVEACSETDPYFKNYDVEKLAAIEQWLSTLDDEQTMTFVDGEETEVLALVATGGLSGQWAHEFFDYLFDGDPDV